MKNENYAAASTAQIHLTRRSPAYWRVTFNHPPLNIFGPETIPQLNEIITALETDEHVKVVVFDSAVQGDRKSTRLNSSHGYISYAVFCLKKKMERTSED